VSKTTTNRLFSKHDLENLVSLPTKILKAGKCWLTTVILPTWEAEIRRIIVPGQPRQTVQKTSFP
jgi:hypothetical protein